MSAAMKDLRIYNYAMGEDAIEELFETYDIDLPGKVAQWKMKDGSGSDVEDAAGDNDGKIIGLLDTNTCWIAGGGIAFNGIDSSHVEVPHADVLDFADESFSISMQVRYDTNDGSTDRWIIKGSHNKHPLPELAPDSTLGSRYEVFKTSGGTVRFSIDNGPADEKTKLEVPGNAFWNGSWNHVVAVRNAVEDVTQLWANGVLQGETEETSGDISSPGEPLWIGESTDETGTAMSGDMKDVCIYNYALTEDEIVEMFEKTNLRAPLVAHWKMKDKSGSVVEDAVADNHGKIVGLLDTNTCWIATGGITFNGIDSSHVLVEHDKDLDFADESFTISMLVRHSQDSAQKGGRYVIKGTHGDPGTGSRYEVFQGSDGSVRFAIDNGPEDSKSSLKLENAALDVITSDWLHIVAVRDAVSDKMYLYFNAEEAGSRDDVSGDISSGEDMWIGESTDEDNNVIKGDMKDVRIYSYALHEDEITELFESYNIKSADAWLKAITLDPATDTLNPDFDPKTFAYDVQVSGGTSPVTVTAELSDTSATVEGDGDVTIPGQAIIVVTAENGKTVRKYIVGLNPVSVEDLTVSSLNAYPNPAGNTLMIDSEVEAISSVNVYNTAGQLVKAVRDINANTVSLDISNLSSGMYLLKVVRGGNAEPVNFRIIKR
jgi:hypothetical protein